MWCDAALKPCDIAVRGSRQRCTSMRRRVGPYRAALHAHRAIAPRIAMRAIPVGPDIAESKADIGNDADVQCRNERPVDADGQIGTTASVACAASPGAAVISAADAAAMTALNDRPPGRRWNTT
ncbi:hypothetical protein KTE69_04135 [Burkholderia multivorans]|uniref:hypothetical protein n=1 Tax=Burkholderia multivorans TaxID=87883 RepID=UPI000A50F7CA|nr:hypothetical protein [Burkholderia multivorans]MBU9237847.1 hypothetical protein [Burkholderia multivorans]MBU9243603.1 hypothetical protein [Burkholderia multivorans]MBU9367569.1 hypothetical protein [Burkholderia multivorans]MCO1345570.1 hypothetical protein [Burkholderia multivorans]MCO1440771.1 hypothetical protein [Burkholderia multivorans]